jgi:CRP-like cAMP-binding protein
MSILLDTHRTMDVFAKENCILYAISVETLKAMVGEKYKDILFLNCIKNVFQTSSCFNKLSADMIENSFECFKIINFTQGSVALSAGTRISDNLILILQGNLINVKHFM